MLVPLLTAVPWLNPFAWGPSPAVVPLLVSGACALALVWSAGVGRWYGTQTRDELIAGFALGWLLAAIVSSGIGVLQYFGISDPFSPWINTTAKGEAFANLRQRNQFASLTNIGLVALVWLAGHGRISGAWLIVAAALVAVGNAASSSRTGLLQLLMVLLLTIRWGGLKQPPALKVMWVATLAYASATITLPLLIGLEFGGSGILGRINDGGAACSSRLILWRNVLDLIVLKPWFGWGWGALDYAHFVTLYPGGPDARFCEILDNAHNLPLHLAVELGVPVALAVCGLGAGLIVRRKPWLEQDATRQLAWSVIAVVLLHSLLEYPLWYGPFQIAFVLCAWLLTTTSVQFKPIFTTNVVKMKKAADFSSNLGENSDRNKNFKSIYVAWAAILTIAIFAYVTWDYHRISQIYLAPKQRSDAYRDNTLAKIQGSWLFTNQVRFAELSTTQVSSENAARINALAHELLRFSPEARVVEKLIDSATQLGREAEAQFYAMRYRAAYPQEYESWAKSRPPARPGS